MADIFQNFGIKACSSSGAGRLEQGVWSSSVRSGARESQHSFRVLSSGPDALLELMFLKLRRTSASLVTNGRAGWSRIFFINCLRLLSAEVSLVVQIVGQFAVSGCRLETCTLVPLVARDGLCALPVQSWVTLLNIVFNLGGRISFASLDVYVFFFRHFFHSLSVLFLECFLVFTCHGFIFFSLQWRGIPV